MSAPFLPPKSVTVTDLPVPDTLDTIQADLAGLVAMRIHMGTHDSAKCVDIDTPLAVAARALHLRRALEHAAEHGAALLASLGLPRLVGPEFVPLDPVAIGEALESTIAALNAMDGDPEAEPWLGWTAAGAVGGSDEREHDTADAELDLGWPANHSQVHLGDNTLDGDLSALERHGRGFLRSGPDDAEADDNGIADEDGAAEQLAGLRDAPVLQLSRGGYVA